ncbi:RNA polymerase recycling motor HelD [Amphibacillus cookii]|uniref:RNA polymerase recycling motor HelD n=1 Tax=Amphibacillus cookii TaxID=767787 RepID=UPI00195F0F23|nr:RNA polymerase recycling motor HelD [Amphibacillus cookii]MBM7540335.1 DNA helicase-2/ATP-dependent DNA helicase PcrA [Amphibacillus cookii]
MSNVQQHPDYHDEHKRLLYTIDYIDSILSIANDQQQQYQINMKEAFINLDYLDSSLSYINILTNARLLDMIKNDLSSLIKIKDKPYFGRIDFVRDQSNTTQTYYIGKVSLYRKDTQEPIIVDWRSPVANLYYDGRLGKVSYSTGQTTYEGNLTKKRQYIIDHGKLDEIRDIDMTTRDELLQKSLAETSDQRLNEIVATIQAEQNNVIRANLEKPMIVQGVAGSGKTTIALHRLSFYIYQYAEQFDPKQLMILAPSKMFIDYISDSLPELGVDRIDQSTFIDYSLACLNKKIKMTNPNQQLQTLITGKQDQQEQLYFVSKFKGSLEFEKIIMRYLKYIRNHFLPNESFKLAGFTIMSSKKMLKLFIQDYRYLPFQKRKEKVTQLLRKLFKNKKKELLNHIEEQFEDNYDKLTFKIKDPVLRQQKVSALLANKEALIKQMEQSTISEVTKFMKKAPKKTVLDYYQALFSDRDFFKTFVEDELTEQQLDWLFKHAEETFLKKNYQIEDLAPLLTMQVQIEGIDPTLKKKYVVIDEGQDYSLFQIRSLVRVTGTRLFTILGDLAQGIHSYRGIDDWQSIIQHALPKANYLTLQKSYRTTIEIMQLANQMISHSQRSFPLADPVIRYGGLPEFHIIKDNKQLIKQILATLELNKQRNLIKTAIICKSLLTCEKILNQLNKVNVNCQLLSDNDHITSDIVVVPVHLAKGLEFDAVILAELDDCYTNTNQDQKLLYVAITRAMHKLDFIASELQTFQLYDEGIGTYFTLK